MADPAGSSSFATRAVAARRSTIRSIFDAANERPDAIRLEIGEPSFPTPDHIVQGAFDAVRAGFTGYTPNGGLATLRELLCRKLDEVNGYSVDADEVVATPGAMNALFSIYLALLEDGDEVLLPTPGFPNMDEMVRLLGGRPVFFPLRAENGFLPDAAEIEELVTPRTKAVFTNSPGNPTGAVYPGGTVERLVDLAHRRDLYLIADEVYDEMILDPELEHVSAARFDERGKVISVYSFSKVYAMTGWRLGYVAASRELADILRKLQEPEVSCPSVVSQKAAEAALTGPRQPIHEMRAAYAARRDRAWAYLTERARHGLRGVRTEGTFYMLLDVSPARMSSMDVALRLLDKTDVAVAPGSVFGPKGEGFVRISLAVEPDVLEEGLERIDAFLGDITDEVG